MTSMFFENRKQAAYVGTMIGGVDKDKGSGGGRCGLTKLSSTFANALIGADHNKLYP